MLRGTIGSHFPLLSCNMKNLKDILQSDDVLALSAMELDQNQRDANGRTPLHQAVAANATDSALWLLDTGKAPINQADLHGETPLMRAAWTGNAALVEALIERGADLAAFSRNGGTALHFAYASPSPSQAVIAHLVDAGANPQALDSDGKQPEDWSAYGQAIKEGASFGKPARSRTLRLRR